MVMGHSELQWRNWYDMQFHPRLAQNAMNSCSVWAHMGSVIPLTTTAVPFNYNIMQLWRIAMLHIRSDALAAAAAFSLSRAPHCRLVIMSDAESDCEEYQSCKSDSMEDSEIELDLQGDDDIGLDLQ